MKENQRLGDFKNADKEEDRLERELREIQIEIEAKTKQESSQRQVKDALMAEEEKDPLFSVIDEVLKKSEAALAGSKAADDQIDEEAPLEMEQIQLETQDEKRKVVEEVFLEPLMQEVNKRIDEKANLERKRLTWNKIRRQEKYEKVQERRSKWKYQ